MKEKEIVIPIFNYGVKMVIGDRNEVLDVIESEYPGVSLDVHRHDKGTYLLIEDNNKALSYDYLLVFDDADDNTIHHEALHLAWQILDSVKVKIDLNNHEILAYLMDYISTKVYELKNE